MQSFELLTTVFIQVYISHFSASTRLLAATTLRNVLGMRDLAQLLSDREAISHMMQASLDEATDPWGVEVERVEIKDVRLPVQLQRAMAAEAEADREARAKIIAAEGEIKASKALKEASLVMIDNPMALQVVKQYKRAVIMRFGRITKDSPAGPGIIWMIPCTDDIQLIDLRTQSFNLPPQEILTKDSVTVTVDAVVYFHIQKPLHCLLNIQNNKKDVFLPFELQKAMAAEAEGTRIAKAKVIESEGEIKAAENLKEASQMMMENPHIMLALTKDALTVAVDAVVYYKIEDPIWAIVNIADYKVATQYLAATTLRNALGTRKLSEILVDRPAVSYQVFGNMKNLTTNWGVKVVRFEVKDISLPLQLQKTMATEAESSRLANAKIIVAKAEIESTKNLQKATKLLMDNPYCMQLRYLQALQMIAGENTHTVVLPITPEMFKGLFK
ncbi:hypothetical protein HF086_000477 [Spodoptera exigua]|uniref:Band 7 domain-containing protein n=1 Tax=Spodoptera exigua TaxID=7107 RepID=A0A922MYN3_SPOEX|nr:hypothetical protein HF086_000477 [Spodoptera exigua]